MLCYESNSWLLSELSPTLPSKLRVVTRFVRQEFDPSLYLIALLGENL